MKDYTLRIKNEAHNWENASPVGAGSLGAMVYGTVATERISYNEETVWDGGEMDTYVPDYKEGLDKIRQFFLDGKPVEGEKWAWENFSDKFFFIKSYEAAGEIYVEMHRDGEMSGYERNLDMKRGILTVEYDKYGKHYKRETFASHPSRLVCTKIDCDPMQTGLIKFVRPGIKEVVSVCEDGHGSMDFIIGTEFTEKLFKTSVRVETDGKLSKDDDNFVLSGATVLYIYVSVVTAFRDEKMDTEKYLKNISKGYEELKREHIADFSGIMGRSDINIGEDEELEKMSVGARIRRLTEDKEAVDRGMLGIYFQFGKYLLVSSSREDTYPANLQGLWCDGLRSPWNADYHTNINLQMNYWPAESANIQECANALFTYMNDCLLPGGRKVAKENYHVGGCVVHHVADIYKFAAAADGIWGQWPLGAAWLSYHMWEHYLYTEDKEYLKNTAYEFIRDSAIFCLDTMVESPEGELLSGPSTSPENSFWITENGKKENVSLSLSPTMDILIIGGLLDFYAEMEDILGINPELAKRAREARAKMPGLKVGKYGQLQEWREDYEEYEPGHRHISHGFGVFPSAQITRKTPELFEAMKKTMDRRLAHGGGHTGWSRAWIMCLFTRTKQGEGAYKNFRALLTNSSLYNLFDNHPPFQIDGNFGGCAAIAEMVMQSHEGFISLLPAISTEMKDGYFDGLLARGQKEVSAKWQNSRITELLIKGEGEALVELPEGQENITLTGADGKTYKADGRMVTLPCGVKFTA